MNGPITIRPGGPADIPAVLDLLDEAGEWLVAQGRTGQWGTQQQSGTPRRQQQAPMWAESGCQHLAFDGEKLVGVLVAGIPVDFVEPAPEPDLYINLLVTSRMHKGEGLGALLLDHARGLARAQGIGLLRLDCYGGGDGKLVRYYEGQGFTVARELRFGQRLQAQRPAPVQ